MNVCPQLLTQFTTAIGRFRRSFVEITKVKPLRIRLWNYVLNFNIFNNRPILRVTPHDIRNEINSTRIFILLLIVILTFFILFIALLPEIKIVTSPNVNKEEYEKLEETYSESLRCPCKKVSIEYKEFSSIEPVFHPICSSFYINDQWFSEYLPYRIMSSLQFFYPYIQGPKNFRLVGPLQFQILSLFCNLSARTVHDNLAVFNPTIFLTSHVVSPSFFQIQTKAFIDLFISSTMNSFNRMLDTIVTTTEKDEFSLTLRPSYLWLHDDNYINKTLLPNLGECLACKNVRNCLNQAVLYTPTSIPSFPVQATELIFPYPILGWYGGCSIMGSLMLSNFECFYSENCLVQMANYIWSFDRAAHEYADLIPYPAPLFRVYTPLNSSKLIQSRINTSIKQIVQKLMVESWNSKVSYSKYFSSCKPTSCTYTYIGKRSLLSIVSQIVGLLGGLTTILKLIVPPLVKFFRRNRKPPPPPPSSSASSKGIVRRRRRSRRRIGCHPLGLSQPRP